MSGKMNNYLTTLYESTKLQKLKYPRKNMKLTSSSIFFAEQSSWS
jgi:hypothetical protein